jgi:metal-dependent amidase/aminoacylase/carboxypeptidase family protein
MSTDFKISTRSSVERYSTVLTDLSHSIHAEPEIAFQEHRSADKVASLLAGEGFEVGHGVHRDLRLR